ncbi:MAG: DUF3157 family protein, partial [Aeromonas sp.]
MKSLSHLLLVLCLVPGLAHAAPFSLVTLADGRQVQLNDDFSWEYLVIKPSAPVQGGEGMDTGVDVPVAAPV